MSAMTSFTRRSLAKNRVRTAVSIVGIALSMALITAIWLTVASLQQGLCQRTIATEGWWQAYARNAAQETIDGLAASGNVTDLAVARDGGVAFFSEEEADALGTGVVVKSLPAAVKGAAEKDGVGITLIPEVEEGRAPEAPGEVMLPDYLRGATLGADGQGGAATDGPLGLGSVLSLDMCRYATAGESEGAYRVVSNDDAVSQILAGGRVLGASGAVVEGYGGTRGESADDSAGGSSASGSALGGSDVRLAARETRSFTVVGFYDGTGAHFYGNDFDATANGLAVAVMMPGALDGEATAEAGAAGTSAADASATDGAGASSATGGAARGFYMEAWASTQGLSSVSEVESLVTGQPASGQAAVFVHGNLMRYQGISDGSLLQDSLWIMASVLAVVVAAASVSLIYNSFSISVAERTRQFGLLASLGASKKQLRRSVLMEALMLGAVGIPCGLVLGIAGTAAVLNLTGAGFGALLSTGEGLSLAVEPLPLLAAAALSLAALLVSAWIPALRAGRVSAVDAIRQVQDVRLSRRARRRAAKASAGAGAKAPFSRRADGGLWGIVAGVPGIIAHRNLSRAAARGRVVVASLAVSVVLVVAAGSVALVMNPYADRAGSMAGGASDADVAVTLATSDMSHDELYLQQESYEAFAREAAQLEGVEFSGSVAQGQMEAVIPAAMLTDAGRAAIQDDHDQTSASWVPQPFGADGSYYGSVYAFYLDDASWNALAESLGVGGLDFDDPSHPRAIALNGYRGIASDASYVDVQPFAAGGTVRAYYGAQEPEGVTDLGVSEGEDGVEATFLDQSSAESSGDPQLETCPADEVAESVEIEVVALADEEPAAANAMAASFHAPVLFLPASIAGALPGEGEDADGGETPEPRRGGPLSSPTPFAFWWASLSYTADDHAQAAESLAALAAEHPELQVNVTDLAEQAATARLAAQTVQVFILCFTVIMALIAVANVFNTLTNSIILRTREFAVLKSAGMGERAFARMLVCECASYALRGLVVGLALAVLVALALYLAMRVAFQGVAFTLPWAYVGAAVALVLVVLAASVAFALRKSHAANVVEALRADAV